MSEQLKFKPVGEPRKPMPLGDREQRVWNILADREDDVDILASRYQVSEQTIRNVKLLKTHVAKRVRNLMEHLGYEVFSFTPARRFTRLEVAAIRASTKASHIIAKEYGCSPSTIRMIKSGQTYADL